MAVAIVFDRRGLGVSELHPGCVAAQEMRELWSSVKRRLKKGGITSAKAEAKQVGKAAAKVPAKPAASLESSAVAAAGPGGVTDSNKAKAALASAAKSAHGRSQKPARKAA